MTRRHFFRRLAAGVAALCGVGAAPPAACRKIYAVSTTGMTAYTGMDFTAFRGQAAIVLHAKKLTTRVTMPPELLWHPEKPA